MKSPARRAVPTESTQGAGLHMLHMHVLFRMKTIQIRNVPDELHRALKVRAAQEGISLSDLALAELRKKADRPTRNELLDRISARTIKRSRQSPTASMRSERDSR